MALKTTKFLYLLCPVISHLLTGLGLSVSYILSPLGHFWWRNRVTYCDLLARGITRETASGVHVTQVRKIRKINVS
jgi:hypothetical protein